MGSVERGSVVVADAGSDRPAEPVVRPNPVRWVWYALGGGLPERNRSWVLHDTTTGSGGLLHVARSLVQVSIPIALVMTLLPAGWGLRAAAAGGGLGLALFYSLGYMPETTQNRGGKAGCPSVFPPRCPACGRRPGAGGRGGAPPPPPRPPPGSAQASAGSSAR